MIPYTTDCDPEMVERLVVGATTGLAQSAIPGATSHEELLSACLTLLDRTLRSVRKLQSPEDRFTTADQVRKVLESMTIDHGHVPS